MPPHSRPSSVSLFCPRVIISSQPVVAHASSCHSLPYASLCHRSSSRRARRASPLSSPYRTFTRYARLHTRHCGCITPFRCRSHRHNSPHASACCLIHNLCAHIHLPVISQLYAHTLTHSPQYIAQHAWLCYIKLAAHQSFAARAAIAASPPHFIALYVIVRVFSPSILSNRAS